MPSHGRKLDAESRHNVLNDACELYLLPLELELAGQKLGDWPIKARLATALDEWRQCILGC